MSKEVPSVVFFVMITVEEKSRNVLALIPTNGEWKLYDSEIKGWISKPVTCVRR